MHNAQDFVDFLVLKCAAIALPSVEELAPTAPWLCSNFALCFSLVDLAFTQSWLVLVGNRFHVVFEAPPFTSTHFPSSIFSSYRASDEAWTLSVRLLISTRRSLIYNHVVKPLSTPSTQTTAPPLKLSFIIEDNRENTQILAVGDDAEFKGSRPIIRKPSNAYTMVPS